MPDRLFTDPALVRLYDPLDPDRTDLDHYLAILDELGVMSVLDVGCGTGTFALLASASGRRVVAVDPAPASLTVARAKPGAEHVEWVHADASTVPGAQVDAVTMTGNVAQVFVSDSDWRTALRSAHAVLTPGGHLIFETRDPRAQAWRRWTRPETYRETIVAGVGPVACWEEVTEVTASTVSFTTTFSFAETGEQETSHSTLRFRSVDELIVTLREEGFPDPQVRDAPDRPGLEFVVIAPRP